MPNLIQRVSNISYGEFRTRHLVTNQPVIVGEELIETWSCLQHWRVANSAPASKAVASNGLPEENTSFSTCSMPNLAYMRIKYGENTVPVDEDGCRSQKALREVIDIWEQEYQSVHETNVAKMYVKDWHLALQLGTSSEEEPFYTTPGIFADDWMNNYYRKYTNDDFRFVYMGPAGTFTRLHRDVYTSYSWSTNVVGRKRWWLFPPTVTSYITRPNGETIADDLSAEASFDLQGIDAAIWPNWHIAKDAMYVVEQEEGETIFVPSGWYHQVLNLTFCISINHNWCNSHNLTSMYYSMVDAVNRVERSIDDVKGLLQKRLPADEWEAEWRRVVQELLKQDAGWECVHLFTCNSA